MSIGIAAGFEQGLESARRRRVVEEERQRQHKQEDLADEAARFNLESARAEAPKRLAQQDLQNEQAQLTLDRVRRQDDREPELLAREKAREDVADSAAQFSLETARTGAQRATTTYQQQQAELRRKADDEGMTDFVRALESGTDPQFAMQRYNERGAHKIQDVQYDPATKQLKVVSPDGRGFNGTLPQLKSALGIADQPLIKLGKDDRLIDAKTHQTVVGAADESDGENSGVGGPRKVSPYNPEGVHDDITKGIMRSKGGAMDLLGNYSIANPEDRQVVDYMVGLGTQMEGRLRRQVSTGRVTSGAIVDAVTEATKDYPTESQLAAKAEEWRTSPMINHSQDDAARWLQTERVKAKADVDKRLAEAEQKLLGQAATPAAPETVQRPDWAGDEVASNVLGDAKLDPGYEYDVTIDGKPSTIRVAPDGKVYQVGGKGKTAAAPSSASGLVEKGNIDVNTRAPVSNPDGSVSTVRSISVNEDGKEVLIPTVVGGRVVSNQEAIAHYRQTGEHLGKFKDQASADAYAEQLHQSEAQRVGAGAPMTPADALRSALVQAKKNTAKFEY